MTGSHIIGWCYSAFVLFAMGWLFNLGTHHRENYDGVKNVCFVVQCVLWGMALLCCASAIVIGWLL